MPAKRDMDSTTGRKLLKLFQRLMLDGHRHFQSDLADWLNCSRQTISRLAVEIENVVGSNLQTGIEKHKRWYQICPSTTHHQLGLNFEELRYLRLCRDLGENVLPRQVCGRIDESIFRFSLLMAEATALEKDRLKEPQFAFFAKGRIDCSPFSHIIDMLLEAQATSRICLVNYRAAGSQVCKLHQFAVGRLVCMNNALYALGADVDEDFVNMRHPGSLAIHRIKSVEITSHPVKFKLPEADPGTFGLPWHEPRDFHIHFSAGRAADYVRERIWADSQTLEELADGSLILHITTRSEPELTAWVRSFGDDACLLADVDKEKA